MQEMKKTTLINPSFVSENNPRLIFMFETPIPTLSPIFPDTVVFQILTRLPIKSLRRFSCVSKNWLKLIKHQNFIDAHKLTQSQSIVTKPESILEELDSLLCSFTTFTSHFFYLENDTRSSVGGNLHKIATSEPKSKIGECNGLVCFMEQDGKIIEICNPSRREIFTITCQTLLYPDGFPIRSRYGFGYDSIKDEYKVVCIVLDFDYVDCKCLVFTLGTNSWREINIPSPKVSNLLEKIHIYYSFCDGALFWRTWREAELVMFDLHDETFQVIQFPERFDPSRNYYRRLLHNGSLCFARWEDEDEDSVGSKNNNKEVHLYILKDKTGPIWIKESFLLPFVTRRCEFITDLSGQVLMYWSDGERVHLYNLHTKDRRIIQPPGGFQHTYCGVTSEVENFLSLKTFVREVMEHFVLQTIILINLLVLMHYAAMTLRV